MIINDSRRNAENVHLLGRKILLPLTILRQDESFESSLRLCTETEHEVTILAYLKEKKNAKMLQSVDSRQNMSQLNEAKQKAIER